MEDALAEKKLSAQMLLQVHDELIFEVPDDEVAATLPVVQHVMQDAPFPAVLLSVPLQVDARAANNWDEAHEVLSLLPLREKVDRRREAMASRMRGIHRAIIYRSSVLAIFDAQPPSPARGEGSKRARLPQPEIFDQHHAITKWHRGALRVRTAHPLAASSAMPHLTSLLGFALVSLGMVLTPGPNMIYLISRSITQGPAAGHRFARRRRARFCVLHAVRGVRHHRAVVRGALCL